MASCKYVISLDALDIALLPSSYWSRMKDPTQLWNANKLNNTTDYFEFEVKPKLEETSPVVAGARDDYSVMAEQESLTCHICNINVPATYIADHEDSLKHKAFVQIADIVLDRARRHMLSKEVRTLSEKPESMYFCGPCVLTVPLADKHIHDKSKAHKHSESLDRLLYEVIVLLTQEDEVEQKSVKENLKTFHNKVKDYKLSTNESNVSVITDNNMKNEIKDSETKFGFDETFKDDNILVISEMKAELKNDEESINKNEQKEKLIFWDDYIKAFNNELAKVEVVTYTEDDVEIKTQDGYKLVVPWSNFHGLLQIDDDCVKCNLCETIVINEDKGTHLYLNEHAQIALSTFKDKHCIRKLDQFWSHCVICNEVTINSDLHIVQDKSHAYYLKKALVFDIKSIYKLNIDKETLKLNNALTNESYNKGQTLLHVPNIDIEPEPVINKNKEIIKKGDPNVIKALNNSINEHHCTKCNITIHVNNIESHDKGSKHDMNCKSAFHYMMQKNEDSNDLVCRVCHVYVKDNPIHVKSHVSEPDHIHKYSTLLNSNNINEKADGSDFYCETCKVDITRKNELYHVEKASHKENFNAYIGDQITQMVEAHILPKEDKDKQNIVNNDSQSHDTTNDYLCSICNVYLTDNPKNVSLHNDGFRHKENMKLQNEKLLKDKSKEKNNDPQSNDKSVVLCKVCNANVPNNPKNIASHNDGYRHQENLALAKTTKPTSETQATSPSTNMDQMDATENGKQLICKLCKTVIPNMIEQIDEHIRGKKHTEKYTNIIEADFEIRDCKYFCKLCKCNVKKENVFVHVDRVGHKLIKSGNSKAQTSVVTDIEKNNVTMTENTDLLEKNAIEKPKDLADIYATFKHHFMELTGANLLTCKVCQDVEITNKPESVSMHTSTKAHMDNYNSLILKHLIFETDQLTFYCGICKCLIPCKGEVLHAVGSRHTANYEVATKATFCVLCAQSVTDMADHITSDHHRVQIIKTQSVLNYCEYCMMLISKGKNVLESHKLNCHKLAVHDKICFCTVCDPYLPGTSQLGK